MGGLCETGLYAGYTVDDRAYPNTIPGNMSLRMCSAGLDLGRKSSESGDTQVWVIPPETPFHNL